MRLIDADALMERLYGNLKDGDFLYRIPPQAIDNAPTVDAVEVVRCKYCKHRRKQECPMYNEKYTEYDIGYGDIEQVCVITNNAIDDGFCYKGERRGD